ncbi:MAG: type II toxin-antitoxin system VapC family toxin [Terriglobia bacterium]
MSLYADTSLLISYYINDSHSVSAQAVLHATTDPLPFTGLHRLEMRNALALGVFRRILTSAQVSTAWSDVERDLRSGRLVPQPVDWRPVYRAAAQWAALHSPRIGCRSLDVLHVTLASKLNAKEFFTFDERQKSLAVVLGLVVKP